MLKPFDLDMRMYHLLYYYTNYVGGHCVERTSPGGISVGSESNTQYDSHTHTHTHTHDFVIINS